MRYIIRESLFKDISTETISTSQIDSESLIGKRLPHPENYYKYRMATSLVSPTPGQTERFTSYLRALNIFRKTQNNIPSMYVDDDQCLVVYFNAMKKMDIHKFVKKMCAIMQLTQALTTNRTMPNIDVFQVFDEEAKTWANIGSIGDIGPDKSLEQYALNIRNIYVKMYDTGLMENLKDIAKYIRRYNVDKFELAFTENEEKEGIALAKKKYGIDIYKLKFEFFNRAVTLADDQWMGYISIYMNPENGDKFTNWQIAQCVGECIISHVNPMLFDYIQFVIHLYIDKKYEIEEKEIPREMTDRERGLTYHNKYRGMIFPDISVGNKRFKTSMVNLGF